ncbi:putative nicotinate-nucleotide adenylyltransferase [Ferriphaselus amnicola]|uniref:Probable nicotinate-nucleotide adenylyltransferase n=1 Tax=Ferriphaselus amnicola TaxID=1188319 RepID=A0A2Z6GEL9_9PROT|nr:nicotinate-nucleotide adenylyltransferase [Ferriphaselus amnicola]BBE52018.1 putative nicotinate-nucleotide adenylyltransferase [Ferriphaselus amnicola]
MTTPPLIRPIGILGGTFDPIHHGHLRLALEALEQCDLRQVRFIPNGTPPHRGTPFSTPQQRLEMVRLALQGNPSFTLDEREIFRAGPCYSVHTLESLREELGAQQPICLLLGSDAFLQLHTWHQWTRLFELAHIVVMQRPGLPLGNAMLQADEVLRLEYFARLAPAPLKLHEQAAGAIVALDMPLLEISATDIRCRAATGRHLRYLVPDSVAWYIHTHHLYPTC